MNYTIVLLTQFFLLLTFSSFSQELYMRVDESNLGAQRFIHDNKIKTFIIFNEPKFITNENLDTKKLLKSLLAEFPIPSSNNYLVLNWELEGIDVLTNQRSKTKFDFYLAEYIRAIRIIKKYRPNLKVGYYGIPFPRWNENDKNYENKANKLGPLIKEQDFLAPSLYILYSKNTSKTIRFTKYNMTYALKLANQYNKPIFPFIWHRGHPIDKGNEWQLLSKSLFQTVTSEITKTNLNGKKIDGVFWWHSENNNSAKKATVAEMRSIKNVDDYRYNVFNAYYKSIKKLFN